MTNLFAFFLYLCWLGMLIAPWIAAGVWVIPFIMREKKKNGDQREWVFLCAICVAAFGLWGAFQFGIYLEGHFLTLWLIAAIGVELGFLYSSAGSVALAPLRKKLGGT